ncbi:transposase [Halomonas sp. MCCC 1A11057]|jgi:transposase-like protein|uniref:transposase n=1 Tax=Halomonas sp. MCCC 1A11057 TaxID=2733482 RepID=UPI001F2BC3AC|nr:transposase [Halomonas sp. MCCC 1A11057]
MPAMNTGKNTPKYSVEFNLNGVQWSHQPHRGVKGVAEALDIHPFMLSRWRKEYREGEFAMSKPKVPPDAKKQLKEQDEVSRRKRRNDFISVLFLLLAAGCADDSTERYKNLPQGGYIAKAKTNTYDVFIVSGEAKLNMVSGKYKVQSEVPGFLKRRVPISVQRMFAVETEECGSIEFLEPLVGDLICTSCNSYVFSRWANCPLSRARVPFEWKEI